MKPEIPECSNRERMVSDVECLCLSDLLLNTPGIVNVYRTCLRQVKGEWKKCPYTNRPNTEKTVVSKKPTTYNKNSANCTHRGQKKRIEKCPTCAGTVKVKIFDCPLHKECTIEKKIGDIACCKTCKDYEEHMSCIYLKGPKSGKKTDDGRQVHECQIHQLCTVEGNSTPYASCDSCKDKLTLDSKNLAKAFQDPLIVMDCSNEQTHSLRGLLANETSFLVCGGPSAKSQPLEQLNQRGIWSMAVNNMAAYFKPSSFVCADPPSKFHNAIWQDPTIMKFVPTPKLRERRGRLRKKVDKKFEDLEINGQRISACHCPNVWGFGRRSWMQPDETFFLDEQAAWGNHNAGVKRTGLKKTVCTMLLGIRLLYYLGSRKIYLVGVDFRMDPSADLQENYAFAENRDAGAVKSNNSQFEIVNDWLCEMQQNGTFEKFGLEIYNCNSRSGLRAFAHVPFEMAVQDTLKDFPEEPFDTVDWYTK